MIISLAPLLEAFDKHNPFPLVNMPIRVRLEPAPRRLTLQPDGVELPFMYENGYAHINVTLLTRHAMLVFEKNCPF